VQPKSLLPPKRFRSKNALSCWKAWADIQGCDPDLTPEQVAELDRRAERALAHPEFCRPLDDVMADIENRFQNPR